jgi:hypothetical protein
MSQRKPPQHEGPRRLALAVSAANLAVGLIRLAVDLFT